MEPELSPIREIPLSRFKSLGPPPSLVIKTDEDVEKWTTTRSYYDYDLFLRRLTHSVTGVSLPWTVETPSEVRQNKMSAFSC